MKRRSIGTLAVIAVLALALASISTALAWTPKGQRGYEGQPGNQSHN